MRERHRLRIHGGARGELDQAQLAGVRQAMTGEASAEAVLRAGLADSRVFTLMTNSEIGGALRRISASILASASRAA